MYAGPVPTTANRIPRWDTRPKHPAAAPGEVDFGQWQKDALPNDAYCMDLDKFVYRIGASGNLRVDGIYELIRWCWRYDLDDIPERLAPYEGKIALLRRISGSSAAGQARPSRRSLSGTAPTFPSSWCVGSRTGQGVRGRRSVWGDRRSPS